MNATAKAGRRTGRFIAGPMGAVITTAATGVVIVVLVRTLDGQALRAVVGHAADQPWRVVLALGAFGAAFVIRAAAWRRVLPALPFRHALAAIHLALGANHVLPFRLGEPLRVLSVTRRLGVGMEAAASSTITLRSADVLSVLVLGAIVAPTAFFRLVGPFGLALFAAVAIVAALGLRWIRNLAGPRSDIRLPDGTTFGLSAGAWLAEAVLVWQVARWADLDLSFPDAVLVTTVAVAAQIIAVTPGGFGTYEAAAVAAFAALGHDPRQALVAAIGAHGLKTAYSLAAGAVAVVAPSPGVFGRVRLAPSPPDSMPHPAPTVREKDRPVLLFMPAHNEEASVAACVRRAPATVLGHPLQVLVIDDGSTDATVDQATLAGAEVRSIEVNRGLGAAVRIGLAEGVARQAVAVAFCDADGEYPPEELENLIRPIIEDDADYVTGSRFLGRIDHMRPHRRLGNRILTALLSLVARRRISDGQTGYRAFSPAAAAAAEVIHDFNYAQVLTLDLLAKGFRLREVPISYHFRTEGESFIKLGRYLRNVVPAVYRELNTA